MVMKGNIDVKNTSAKILCFVSMRENSYMKYPGRPPGRGFQGDAVRQRGLGDKATP